jgi:iron complex outermembrane receptor protein
MVVADATINELTTLSLEALMDIEVTSASRKSQRLANTAAAVFVINQDDIRRSGATNLPDLLRMAPGVQVARIDSNKWAVSIRGANGRYSNKLLVLKDGRSIYTPLFSGVYWETQNTPLEDIERIEVIRGPGAVMWGSNAVNGVINIISKRTVDTSGWLVSLGGGSFEKNSATVRYGTATGTSSDLSVYARRSDTGNGENAAGSNAHDAWDITSAGFRLDTQLSARDTVNLQGDFYYGNFNETYTLYRLPSSSNPTYSWIQPTTSRANGGNLLGRWQRTLSDTDSLSLQLSYDHYQRDMVVLDEIQDTVDLDLQHRFAWGSRNDIIWGLGYRFSHDNLGSSPFITFANRSRKANLFSTFLYDEISLVPAQLALILGSRFERNDYTGLEIQPTGRIIWTPSTQHTYWGAVSRAVRTPFRGENDIEYRYRTLPPGAVGNPLPMQLMIVGNSSFAAESIMAYEGGYRAELPQHVTADISLFYNDYRKLRVLTTGAPTLLSATSMSLPMILTNNMHGHTYGYEASATWSPNDWWRLQCTYGYLRSVMYLDNGSSDETNRRNAASGSPRHQFSLRSGFDLGSKVELDIWLRGADRVESIDNSNIPGYFTTDVRLSWKPEKKLELSLVGQNLLSSRHPEYIPEMINTFPSEVPRSVYGKVTWKY